jgi:tetratricopeptide (TPR) repeat protein
MKALGLARNCETLANVALLILQTEPERRDEAYALAREALRSIAPGTADTSGSENDLGQKRAYLAIGVYHLQRLEWSESARFLRAANETGLFTENPLYWEWVAIACYRTAERKLAREAITRALELKPGNTRYRAMRELIENQPGSKPPQVKPVEGTLER